MSGLPTYNVYISMDCRRANGANANNRSAPGQPAASTTGLTVTADVLSERLNVVESSLKTVNDQNRGLERRVRSMITAAVGEACSEMKEQWHKREATLNENLDATNGRIIFLEAETEKKGKAEQHDAKLNDANSRIASLEADNQKKDKKIELLANKVEFVLEHVFETREPPAVLDVEYQPVTFGSFNKFKHDEALEGHTQALQGQSKSLHEQSQTVEARIQAVDGQTNNHAQLLGNHAHILTLLNAYAIVVSQSEQLLPYNTCHYNVGYLALELAQSIMAYEYGDSPSAATVGDEHWVEDCGEYVEEDASLYISPGPSDYPQQHRRSASY
ncbi:hypothetical protein K458DRAFT_410941 [Lentithecium fluviatile CBS 122367]|uniref:Uncharacterized protein n=1 Tax=Lentithecium fluviatile CBS 122367 TaxID=1168545 RepID=A0A6G1IC62_9PLEO|nr:hypothetical protein K458DRAFT_410941 [Lentithecium fluviatile CBS 122367]